MNSFSGKLENNLHDNGYSFSQKILLRMNNDYPRPLPRQR